MEEHARHERATAPKPQADVWAGMRERGAVSTRAELARRAGVLRARVTQVLGAETAGAETPA